MNRNFGLSPDDFDEIVADLKKNETTFFEKVFLQHFKECQHYLQKEFNADQNDAYDATMDTMIEFRRRLVEGKLRYGNLRFLFTKMATQIYVRNRKSFQSQAINDQDIEISQATNSQDDILLLNKIWPKLEDPCKELLTKHYYGKMKLTDIATRQQKSAVAIRKQKERCVSKLRSLLASMKND